jgi:SAM-dependent methyltransferase
MNQEVKKIQSQSERSYCCGSEQKMESNTESIDNLSDETKVRQAIRNQYASIATNNGPEEFKKELKDKESFDNYTHYSQKELSSIPEKSNLGLGSGNPVALANIKQGEVVVDLGSGAGVDCFLASKEVGKSGKIIGVDMTPQMIDKARENARKNGYSNIEFRLGEIEHLPVENNSVDVIVSNCVINLALDKKQVFRDAFRVLKPGGRLVVSDIVYENELPDKVKNIFKSLDGCVSRAWLKDDYLNAIQEVGFRSVEILESQEIKPQNKAQIDGDNMRKRKLRVSGKSFEVDLTPEEDDKLMHSVLKAHIQGIKPI